MVGLVFSPQALNTTYPNFALLHNMQDLFFGMSINAQEKLCFSVPPKILDFRVGFAFSIMLGNQKVVSEFTRISQITSMLNSEEH